MVIAKRWQSYLVGKTGNQIFILKPTNHGKFIVHHRCYSDYWMALRYVCLPRNRRPHSCFACYCYYFIPDPTIGRKKGYLILMICIFKNGKLTFNVDSPFFNLENSS